MSPVSSKRLREYAGVFREVAREETLFVVTGGGGLAREYISVARSLGAAEAFCDLIGIEVTRLNARLLISALGESAYPFPPASYQEALELAGDRGGKIVVMGGILPGQTTDTVAAVLAELARARLLVNASSVDGVYNKDPRQWEDAVRLERITPAEMVELALKQGMGAGVNIPFDMLAAQIIERSNIPTRVIDGRQPQNILAAILENTGGTLIKK